MDEIEEKFLESWSRIRAFYDYSRMGLFLGKTLSDLMLQFISEMEAAGYSKYLRAGQSLQHLILSRSREHGSLGEYYICFIPEFESDVVNGNEETYQRLVVSYHADSAVVEEFEVDKIALNSRIQKLLQTLSEKPL